MGAGGIISTADGSSNCGVGTFENTGSIENVGGGGIINTECPPVTL
jgi:hypothetical protein